MNATEKLKAKQAEELRKAEQEDAIREKLPDVGFEWSIHCHELYGTVGSVNLSQSWGYNQPSPTLETLLAVAEAIPGLPMVRVKGTYTGYLAAAQLPHYGDRRGLHKIESEEAIAPWIAEAHGGPGARNHSQVDLKWVAQIEGIGLVSVKFELPFMMDLRFSAHRKDYMGGHRYEDERIDVNRDKLYTIYGPDDSTPVAEMGPSTRWGSGSDDYPRSITQAWTPLDDPATCTTADFARALIAANQKN